MERELAFNIKRFCFCNMAVICWTSWIHHRKNSEGASYYWRGLESSNFYILKIIRKYMKLNWCKKILNRANTIFEMKEVSAMTFFIGGSSDERTSPYLNKCITASMLSPFWNLSLCSYVNLAMWHPIQIEHPSFSLYFKNKRYRHPLFKRLYGIPFKIYFQKYQTFQNKYVWSQLSYSH